MRVTEMDLQQAEAPIASLISKSEKAQGKVAAGTWQHTMLEKNLRALRLASSLMTGQAGAPREDLAEAAGTLKEIIARVESTEKKFPPGTAQHTLQRNRLKALRVAEALVKGALSRFGAGEPGE